MAETTKKAEKAIERVTVRLPLLRGQHAVQEEFFSVNGKNYRIKRGETVEIPVELAEIIKNAKKGEEYALNYINELTKAEADKKSELGIN